MNKNNIIIFLLTLSVWLAGCSNKDADEEAQVLIRPIRTCDGLQAKNGRAYIEGGALHISVTVTAPRLISTYRIHGPTTVSTDYPPIEVYELNGYFGQEYQEDEYTSQIDVVMARSEDIAPGEIVIRCKQGETTLVRITLEEPAN